MPAGETDWSTELQSMWDALAGSTVFWVVGAVAVLLALGSLLRGGRR